MVCWGGGECVIYLGGKFSQSIKGSSECLAFIKEVKRPGSRYPADACCRCSDVETDVK